MGYRVQDAEPGRSLPARVTGRQFDLDIDSAAGGGLDCIRAVRGVSSIPILALSTGSEEDAMIGALEVGAELYPQTLQHQRVAGACQSALHRRGRSPRQPTICPTKGKSQ